MGRLIPAGTGLPAYKRLQVVVDEGGESYAVPPTYQQQPVFGFSSVAGEE
jgi:DNA-directed RNA polymerase subunit beta'